MNTNQTTTESAFFVTPYYAPPPPTDGISGAPVPAGWDGDVTYGQMIANFFAACCGNVGTLCPCTPQMGCKQSGVCRGLGRRHDARELPTDACPTTFHRPNPSPLPSPSNSSSTPPHPFPGQLCLTSLDRSKLVCVAPKPGYVVDDDGVVSALASCSNQARGTSPLLPVLPGPHREPDLIDLFHHWDTDASSSLTFAEFSAGMVGVNSELKALFLNCSFEIGDTSGDAHLSFTELAAVHTSWAGVVLPQCRPSPTAQPTPLPTPRPTAQPMLLPTPRPTARPTPLPTPKPTSEPSPVPSTQPTHVPTPKPTSEPSPRPSTRPTHVPTPRPSAQPTPLPTDQPTAPAGAGAGAGE